MKKCGSKTMPKGMAKGYGKPASRKVKSGTKKTTARRK